MNKSELINVMAEEAGLTKVQAKIALEALVGATEKALKKGERLALLIAKLEQVTILQRAKRSTSPLRRLLNSNPVLHLQK